MREIKFRAWDGEKMVIVNDIVFSGKTPKAFWRENSVTEWSENIMQFTGLLDKNGKEIYEGDILGFEFTKNFNTVIEHKFVMKWDNENAAWINFSPKNKIVIIGNIHQNHELI